MRTQSDQPLRRLEGPEMDALRKEGLELRKQEHERRTEFHEDKKHEIAHAEFNRLLREIYEHGADPDIVYMTLERAFAYGMIGLWEFRWRRLLRWFRLPQPSIKWRDRPRDGA